MGSLFIFIVVSAFSLGITVFVLAVAFLRAEKSPLARYFLWFLAAYLAVMAVSTVLYYAGLPHSRDSLLYLSLQFVARVSTAVLLISLILLVHRLVNFPQSAWARRAVRWLCAAGTALFLVITGYYILKTPVYERHYKVFEPSDLFVYGVAAYALALILLRRNKIQSPQLRAVVRRFMLLAIVLVPTLFMDDLQIGLPLLFAADSGGEGELSFLLFPLYYIVLNAFLLYHGYRTLIAGGVASAGRISEAAIARYRITRRERELIELLLEGCSNKAIGNRLFISPATVRNHLHNIFEKTGARNRLELTRLMQQP